jgi:hypothetical protein
MEKMILVIMICQIVELLILCISDIALHISQKHLTDSLLDTPTQSEIEEKLKELADKEDMTFINIEEQSDEDEEWLE